MNGYRKLKGLISTKKKGATGPTAAPGFSVLAAFLVVISVVYSGEALTQDLYVGTPGSCYDLASCFAVTEAWRQDPENEGGVTLGDCHDNGSKGPERFQGNVWDIVIQTSCERLAPPPIGVFSHRQHSFYTTNLPPECDNGLTIPPSCPVEFVLEVPEQNCGPAGNNESNPCDPATGNKSQTETDYAGGSDGALRFERHYNSLGAYRTADGMVAGWRHSYSRALNERPDKHPFKLLASARQSAAYGSRREACTGGWEDIKSIAYAGDLAGAVASYIGENTCAIELGGSVVAYFRVRSKFGAPIYAEPDVKIVTRPNGASHRFELDNGAWVNKLDSSMSLEQVGSDFVFTDSNDTKETYNAAGRLISIALRNGQTETLEYNLTTAQGGDGKGTTLDRVTGPYGHTIDFSYDSSGRLGTISTPSGTTQYSYDASNNLTTVTRPDSTIRTYHYENTIYTSHLTGITDENNSRFSTWAYDSIARPSLS